MVELRKRKTPPPAAPKPAKKERKPKAEEANGDVPSKAETSSKAAPSKASSPPKVGDKIDVETFGGEIETNDGDKTSVKALLDKSKAGIVLFTYPKASTPGCTTQACLFRDAYKPLTATGLDIYGLSRDSPKSNTTFKTKQNLPYPLLCDKAATLIGAIGFKKGDSTQRGVFVVTKAGEVLAAEPGGPAATVDVVKALVEKMGGADGAGEEQLEQAEERAEAGEAEENKENDAKL